MGFQIRALTQADRFYVIDIGSSRIKVLLCSLVSGELQIDDQVSVRQSKKHSISGEISDLQGVAHTVKKALDKISPDHESSVKDVIFSLQSTEMVSDILSMNYVRDQESAPLDMEEIDTMVAKIEMKSLEKAEPKILSRILRANTQMKLVTTTLTSIVIDGKKVSNPIGFTGKNISLTVCNVFIPISVFHVYSGLERSLGLNLISFVPVGIALPKALENSLELFDPNLCIDFGASSTTLTLENYSEILGSFTIPFGSSILEDLLSRSEPTLSRLEIQHRIIDAKDDDTLFQKVKQDYIGILRDAIRVALRDISPDAVVRNIYLSGGVVTEGFRNDFVTSLGESLPYTTLLGKTLIPTSVGLSAEYGVAYALARTAAEIVLQKQDPIARILRYVIYRYE